MPHHMAILQQETSELCSEPRDDGKAQAQAHWAESSMAFASINACDSIIAPLPLRPYSSQWYTSQLSLQAGRPTFPVPKKDKQVSNIKLRRRNKRFLRTLYQYIWLP